MILSILNMKVKAVKLLMSTGGIRLTKESLLAFLVARIATSLS